MSNRAESRHSGLRRVKAAIISLSTHRVVVQKGGFKVRLQGESVFGLGVSCQGARVIQRSPGSAVSPRSEITLPLLF